MDNKLDLSQLQVYLDHLRSHGRKESTIRNRSVEIRHCLNLIRSLGRSTRIEDLTVEDQRIEEVSATVQVKRSGHSLIIKITDPARMLGVSYGDYVDITIRRH